MALPGTKKESEWKGWKYDDLLVLFLRVGRWGKIDWESHWKNQEKLSELRKLSA